MEVKAILHHLIKKNNFELIDENGSRNKLLTWEGGNSLSKRKELCDCIVIVSDSK